MASGGGTPPGMKRAFQSRNTGGIGIHSSLCCPQNPSGPSSPADYLGRDTVGDWEGSGEVCAPQAGEFLLDIIPGHLSLFSGSFLITLCRPCFSCLEQQFLDRP